MQVIEKETFAFDLLNNLFDNYNLNGDDYGALAQQIWAANDHGAMDRLLSFLQRALLVCMRGW